MGVLLEGGLLAPGGMVGPELLADVGQLEPGVHQDPLAVAGLNQPLQVGIGFRAGLEIVPGGDVQGGDPGLAPAGGKVVHVHARAVGGIEEGPQTVGAEGRVHAEIGESVQQIRKALAATLAGRRGHPEDGAGAALQAGRHGGAGPAFGGKHLRAGRHFENGQLQPLFPHDGQRGTVYIGEALHAHRVLAGAAEAEEAGEGGLAFEDQNGAVLYAVEPFDAGRGAGARHENPRYTGGLPLEPDGGKDVRPGSGVLGEDAEVGQLGGGGGGGEEKEAESAP